MSERADFNGKNYEDRFIGDLVSFVAGDKFQKLFETFFIEHAMEFTNTEEHKLEWYDIYQTFHGLFEEQLEAFCDEKGFTQAEFMLKCREASTEDAKAKHYINILLSSVEYDTFVKLMKIMRPVAERRLAQAALLAAAAAAPKAETKGEPDSDDKSAAPKDASNEVAATAGGKAVEVEPGVGAPEKASSKAGDDDLVGGGGSKGVDDDVADAKGVSAASDSKGTDDGDIDQKGSK